jgi:hypothetical protein
MRESAYFKALQTALHGAGVPYGYAVTVWGTGAALVGEHDLPQDVDIYLFVAGATAAYGGLRLLTWETGGEAETPLPRSPNLFRAGLVHLVSIGAAITAALLIAQVGSRAAWILAPLAATVLYLGVSSVEVAAVESDGGS